MVNKDNEKLLSLSKSELIVIIFKQADEIELLKTRIIDLEEKMQQKGNVNKSLPV